MIPEPPSCISKMQRSEKVKIALELRAKGVHLIDIAKTIGFSKAWTWRLLKRAGAPRLSVTVDKNGRISTLHGLRKCLAYETWHGMKYRCGKKSSHDYPNYGGRGISYDPRWESFIAFFEDMGDRPSKDHTLERKDNDGNYSKDNCIWILKSYQQRNQRTTKLTIEKVREIRKLYASGIITQRKLAANFGVAQSSIGFIVNNKKWKE